MIEQRTKRPLICHLYYTYMICHKANRWPPGCPLVAPIGQRVTGGLFWQSAALRPCRSQRFAPWPPAHTLRHGAGRCGATPGCVIKTANNIKLIIKQLYNSQHVHKLSKDCGQKKLNLNNSMALLILNHQAPGHAMTPGACLKSSKGTSSVCCPDALRLQL